MREYYEKRFMEFDQGIKELMSVSSSAKQSIYHYMECEDCPESGFSDKYGISLFKKAVLSALAQNVLFADAQAPCKLSVCRGEVSYITAAGLEFGWEQNQEYTNEGTWETVYTFFVSHPTGKFPADSTLAQSCANAGWKPNKW